MRGSAFKVGAHQDRTAGILQGVGQDRIELVKQTMPPEGSDLVEAFGPGGQVDSGGLVRDDATVKMTARSAEIEDTGPDAFRNSWADWLEPWESYRIFYDDILERDDRVIVLVTLKGVTKRDQVAMEHEGAGIFRFEGDEVVELEFTLARDEALGHD
jgi:hypothetical protein